MDCCILSELTHNRLSWDKCQTLKKDFDCLRLSLGFITEFVSLTYFTVALKGGAQNTGLAASEWVFHLRTSYLVFGFEYFGLNGLTFLRISVALFCST